MITLFELSLRQAVGGRRVWVMLGLATIPVLLAAMLSAFADEATPLELSDADHESVDHLAGVAAGDAGARYSELRQ